MRWLRFPLLLSVMVLCFLFAVRAAAQVRVLTGRYDNARTGENLQETVLTPQNVNSTGFGKLFSWAVDGEVYAQPLYLPGVTVPGVGTRNLIFIATEHDSVYAFDADAPSASPPLWHVSFLNASQNITSLGSGQVGCGDMIPEIGITGTPVIDPASGTLYLVTVTSENGAIIDRLHALDVATGAEKPGSPVRIQARVPGTGAGSSNGYVSFHASIQRQRSALLLLNGVLYINWGSYCDHDAYHGWVMSYSAQSLTQLSAFCSTPNGSEGGIWQAGTGPSADSHGNVYEATGNGSFDGAGGGLNWGDSVLRLNSNLQVDDSFTPSNQAMLFNDDQDLGSSGPVVLPDQSGANPHLTVVAGKTGTIYLLNRDGLGGYDSSGDRIVQELTGAIQGAYGGPAYFNGTLYYAAGDDHLKAFPLRNGLIAASSVTQAPTSFGFPGAEPVISANGSQNGIVWAVQTDQYPTSGYAGGPAILHAYDAANVARELYNSTQAGSRDQAGTAVKFAVPTIVNGRVYVGTRNEVDVYGLLNSGTPGSSLPLPTVSQLTATSVTLTWTTAQALNTQAWYGPAQPSAHAYDWALATQHSITLTGLQPDTTYQVQTESSDFSDPDLTSPVFTVTTAAAAPAPSPDFSVALSPAVSAVAPNAAAHLTLTTTALNGDSRLLTLTCAAPASGCTVSPATLTPGQSATVAIAASALQSGNNAITVSASDGTNRHTAAASITVTTGVGLALPAVTALSSSGFTLVWSTAQALNSQVWYGTAQPSAQVYDWTLATQHKLTVTGLQPGTTYQVQTESSWFSSPDLISPVFTVTTLAASAPPDFSLALMPATSTAAPGTAVSLSVITTALNGDTAPLTLTCTAPTSGCTVSPATLAPGQSATLTVAATALQSGNNTVTVSARDGASTHTASAEVTVADSTSGLPLPTVSQLTSTSVTLTWTTAQALNTQAWYGPSQPTTHAYDWTLTTQHSLTLAGLQPNTTYQVQTESSYFTDPDLTSPVFTVTTAP